MNGDELVTETCRRCGLMRPRSEMVRATKVLGTGHRGWYCVKVCASTTKVILGR
jgi:hypothetical protein